MPSGRDRAADPGAVLRRAFEEVVGPVLRAGLAPVAIGWATVDTERAAADLAAVWPGSGPFEPGAIDELLGAHCALGGEVELAGASGVRLVIVEPATEGRLAAALARRGEGPVAVWATASIGTTETASPPWRRAAGPFGPETLLPGPMGGAHLLLVERAASTIAGMTDAPPIALRAASAADAERIATLFTEEGYPAGPSDILGRLGRYDSAHARVIVAELDGEVLGFIALHALPRFEHDDWIVRILALVVDAGVRERGVGHLLMGEAENVGRELGAAFTEVTAGHHRPEAQRLFESLGYDATVTTYLRKRL